MNDEGAGVAATSQAGVPVRKSVRVEVDRERAFAVFTEGLDSWWLREHHIGAAELAEVVLEPRAGGRWYERGIDGSECDWGSVLAWEPPARVVLSWQINGNWQYDPDLVTEIEVTFTPDGAGATRVELAHRYLERLGAAASGIRQAFESEGGWSRQLHLYAERARPAS